MRRAATLLVPVLLLAGCIERTDEDPFAYMRKPLYASAFQLGGPAHQEFRVEDGSIVEMKVQVWVNATTGTAKVAFTNPSGRLAHEAEATGSILLPVELGVWKVDVASEGAKGHVSVLVTRA